MPGQGVELSGRRQQGNSLCSFLFGGWWVHMFVLKLFSSLYMCLYILILVGYISKQMKESILITAIKKIESEVAQSCLTLWDPIHYYLPGSSVHGILQARVLEWVAISFSRGSSQRRDWTRVSCTAGRRFTILATKEASRDFPDGSDGKASVYNMGDLGLIPARGRSPERKGNPLQYSFLENPMDGGAW